MSNERIALEICNRILELDIQNTDPFTLSGLAENLLKNIDSLNCTIPKTKSLRYTVNKELAMAMDEVKENRKSLYDAISLIRNDVEAIQSKLLDLLKKDK